MRKFFIDNNANTNDFKESVNRSLDKAKDNIRKSIGESKNRSQESSIS